MEIFRWVSYIGLFLVFVSTVGTSVFQAKSDKAKDQKIDNLVTTNTELLSKITQYQDELKVKESRINELETQSKKAARNISSMYDFNGARRQISGGTFVATAGEEMEVFRQMLELERKKDFPALRDLCENQIRKTPDWLTPYLFLGEAYINLGEKDKAEQNLVFVVENAPGDPNYREAQTMLEGLKNRK